MTITSHRARALWTLFEPIHAVTYFSREAREAFAEVGLTRYWDGYFAGRAAPLGAVNAAPVVALFSGFSPFFVHRALPSVWTSAAPERVLEARSVGAAATLRGLVDDNTAARAAEALAPVVAAADVIGRPLGAANKALQGESDPFRALWQSTATLRELRGDGHVIALVTEGIAGLAAVILRASLDLDAVAVQRSRGWTDDEWMLERSALADRGLLESVSGRTTPEGVAALARAEELTNRLAAQPWSGLGDTAVLAVAAALQPVAQACLPLYPFPNPIGMPEPWNPLDDPEALRVPTAPRG